MQNHINESNRFEALFNHASMGILVANSIGTIESVNPFALQLFGYKIEELTDRPIELLIPKRYHSKHVHHRDGYIHNPKSRPMGLGMDLFASRKDGTEFPVEVSLGNFKYNDEVKVIAFISDISVRKKAEVEIEKLNNDLEITVEQRTKDLKETLKQLEFSSDRLERVLSFQKALLDNAGAIIFAFDRAGIIQLFNPEAVYTIGYQEQEVIDKETPLLFIEKKGIETRKIKADEVAKNDLDFLLLKSKLDIHEEEEHTYIKKNGQTFPVSQTITTIRDSQGNIIGYVGIAIDISERKKTEENLMASLEKEKELGELKTRFVSMASHEFRTPLSTVLSSAYLIEKYTTAEDQPKRNKHLQRIISSVSMLTDILNDFLSVGKIEEGKIQVRLTDFDIQYWIHSIIEEIRDNVKAGQQIKYIHDGNAQATLDVSLLKHILLNLVSNASKFSPENSDIEIHTCCDESKMEISVKDKGIGISEEDQKHLMERFFRGTNASHIQGTGLGLHIVSKYAELMDGTVTCKSQLEQGTEFIVTFINNDK